MSAYSRTFPAVSTLECNLSLVWGFHRVSHSGRCQIEADSIKIKCVNFRGVVIHRGLS